MVCGIDWARSDHAVVIIDCNARAVYRGIAVDSTEGLKDLITVLARHGVAEVAIERPDGPMVEAVLDADLTVVVINPNQIKNLRSRYGSAGNKDDRFAALHHPCCGDLTYGANPKLAESLGLQRQWLHVRSLHWRILRTAGSWRSSARFGRICRTRWMCCARDEAVGSGGLLGGFSGFDEDPREVGHERAFGLDAFM